MLYHAWVQVAEHLVMFQSPTDFQFVTPLSISLLLTPAYLPSVIYSREAGPRVTLATWIGVPGS